MPHSPATPPRSTHGPIAKAAVIGAGVMGAGIAAHLANAGVAVVLLDIEERLAQGGRERQLKAGGFMDPDFADRIRPGATSADMALLADADWIIEAAAERLEIKQAIYRAIEGVRKPGSVVSSNTSTLQLSALVDGMPERFAADFLIAHFFNPPRRMRLLEIITGPRTDADVAARIETFCDVALGKSVVPCKDTPGFIANRIGGYWLAAALNAGIASGLDIETMDALLGAPFGVPSTGVFGLMDLVGIDLMPAIWRSLRANLPASDPIQAWDAEPPLVKTLLAEGRLGRKSGAGFFRVSADRRVREAVELATGAYRPQRPPALESLSGVFPDPRRIMAEDGAEGRLVATVMGGTLAYAAGLVPEIADDIAAVDEAMREGYGWRKGPFELIDALGAEWLAGRLHGLGMGVPPLLSRAAAEGGFYAEAGGQRMMLMPGGGRRALAEPDGVLTIAALQRRGAPAADFGPARLWDFGEGVAGLELRTKLNTFDAGLLKAVEEAGERVKADFSALVIGSDAPAFSAGANLKLFLEAAERGDRAAVADLIDFGQRVFAGLKYAPFPVVGAAGGLALGGGCEILLHCDSIVAHAELAIGLVEPRVGLVPGWGGCAQLLLRLSERADPAQAALAAFCTISAAASTGSAFEARKLGFLRPGDAIAMNRARLLADAKTRALALAEGYRTPDPATLRLSGPAGAARLGEALGRLSGHDAVIGGHLVTILTGGDSADPDRPVPEAAVMALEKEAFLSLFDAPATIARLRHMLETGKPLGN